MDDAWRQGYVKRLTRLRDRYFRPTIAHPEGDLVHFAFCDIHRAIDDLHTNVPCSCGLLMDLPIEGGIFAHVLYFKYGEDLDRAHARPGSRYHMTPEQRAIADAEHKEWMDGLLKEANQKCKDEGKDVWFSVGNATVREEDWGMIAEVFGKAFAERCRTLAEQENKQ